MRGSRPPANPGLPVVVSFENKHASYAHPVTTRLDRTPVDGHRIRHRGGLASRLTILYAPSGVGKSSVLRAGVAHHLRGVAAQNLAERGTPEFAVVVFSSWRDDPVAGLVERVEASVAQPLQPTLKPGPSRGPLPKMLHTLAQRAGGELFIIMDQFEEYFLYHVNEDGEDSFATQFPAAVNHPNLRVNFLLSVREDALAKLDRFKGRIPSLFTNYLRIDHLDRDAACEAITKPIAKFNDDSQFDGPPVAIQRELVEAVLDQVKVGEDVLGQGGRGVVANTHNASHGKARIETPYLQLVMIRLWEEEMYDPAMGGGNACWLSRPAT
jgi:hypothetical protein